MATLPTDRDTADSAADHVTDHNTLHGLNNQLGSFTQAASAPGSPTSGDLWLDTDEVAQSGTTIAGQIIGFKQYHPASDSVITLTTSLADIDATNLVVSFTGPASGLVIVEFSVVVFDPGEVMFNLRDGSGNIADTTVLMLGNVANILARLTYTMPVAVTPTTAYTWKMGGKATAGTGHVRYGKTYPYGPAVIKVLAGP